MRKHPYLYSVTVIFILWMLISTLDIKYIPSPVETLSYMATRWPWIGKHLVVSLFRIFTAILFTMFLGSTLGIALGRSSHFDKYISPLFYTLYPVPKIAFLPLLILVFGIGNGSKIVLVILILLFQTVLSIRDAVKNIPDAHFLAMKSLAPSRGEMYRHLIIPAILPALFTALRLSIGTGLSVLFFSENYATNYGIGYYIMDNWLKMDYTGMFAGIVTISLMGSLLFGLIDETERRLCPWNN
jgi:NitT/TauT family transport system permease protein